MQISSGWAKGMSLLVPAGLATRPTSAKVRAAILNMMAPVVDRALVLDVFAGSGALGIEAVSRGARGAVFVEAAPAAAKCLEKNLVELERRATAQGLEPPRLEVVARDAEKAMTRVAQLAVELGPFELICMDPPYRDAVSWLERLGPRLATVAGVEARLVVETSAAAPDVARLAAMGAELGFPWRREREKLYGETMVTVWEKKE